jgi:hypothetical protein
MGSQTTGTTPAWGGFVGHFEYEVEVAALACQVRGTSAVAGKLADCVARTYRLAQLGVGEGTGREEKGTLPQTGGLNRRYG